MKRLVVTPSETVPRSGYYVLKGVKRQGRAGKESYLVAGVPAPAVNAKGQYWRFSHE